MLNSTPLHFAFVYSKAKLSSDEDSQAVDERLGKALTNLNSKKFEEELASLGREKGKKGKSAAVFNLQQRVLGSKKTALEALAVEDPETGILIDDPVKIKEVSLKYCTDLLTNRKPNPGYENVLANKIQLDEERMKEIIDNYVEE